MPRIAIICPLLPLRSGIAIYSHKLLTNIQNFMPIIVLANQGASKFYNQYKRLKIIECWNFSSAFSFISILRAILRVKPKIVHLQLGYTWIKNPFVTQLTTLFLFFLLKLFRIRTIVTLHGVVTHRTLKELFKHSRILHSFASIFAAVWILFYYCLVRLTDIIIVHNHIIKRALVNAVGIKFSSKIHVIPHGVDKAQVSISLHKKPTINLLFIGFLRESKGLDDLIKAFRDCLKKIPNLRLTIAGPLHIGDNPKFLEKLLREIKKYNLQEAIKIIAKFLSEEELDKLIKASDIIVLPYKDFFYEASGVLARVMDYSKPIICTAIPKFCAELDHGKDAILIPPSNWKALRDSILLLSSDLYLRKRLAENLKRKAKDRYWEKAAKKHIQIYFELARI